MRLGMSRSGVGGVKPCGPPDIIVLQGMCDNAKVSEVAVVLWKVRKEWRVAHNKARAIRKMPKSSPALSTSASWG